MAYIYIAGPYTQGNVAENVRKAISAGEELLLRGHTPYVPHLSHFWEMHHPHPYRVWMELDKKWLLKCDALLRLKGDSPGADEEVEFALTHGIRVFNSSHECSKYFTGVSNGR